MKKIAGTVFLAPQVHPKRAPIVFGKYKVTRSGIINHQVNIAIEHNVIAGGGDCCPLKCTHNQGRRISDVCIALHPVPQKEMFKNNLQEGIVNIKEFSYAP